MSYQWHPPSKTHKPLWEGKLIQKIELSNGLILEIWNYSRKVAGDRWLVGFLAQIGIEPEPEDFSSPYYYERFKSQTDGKVYYRYRKERNFIPENQVEEIYHNLKETFLKAVLPYLSKEEFKQRLVKHEIQLFEKKVDWEDSIKKREKELEELEKLWANRKYF